jgi:hypothetical protein
MVGTRSLSVAWPLMRYKDEKQSWRRISGGELAKGRNLV